MKRSEPFYRNGGYAPRAKLLPAEDGVVAVVTDASTDPGLKYEVLRSVELGPIRDLVRSLLARGYRLVAARWPDSGEFRLYMGTGPATRGLFCCRWVPKADEPWGDRI